MTAFPYQATCVAIGGRGVLIEGDSGTGKSSLALALIDRGAKLVGDDSLLLEARDGKLWALPHPNIAGLLEIRNVGLATFPATAAPIALVIRLDRDAERLPEEPEQVAIGGVNVPMIRLFPDSPFLHLRAEWALALRGAG